MGAARKIAEAYVGQRMQLAACWQPPTGIYQTTNDQSMFYFVAIDPTAHKVGGTLHISVDRRDGRVAEFMVGE